MYRTYTTGVYGPYNLSEGRPDLDVLVLVNKKGFCPWAYSQLV